MLKRKISADQVRIGRGPWTNRTIGVAIWALTPARSRSRATLAFTIR